MPGGSFWLPIPGSGGGGSVPVVKTAGTGGGDYTIASATLTAIDTTNLRLTVPAVTGDVLEFSWGCAHVSSTAMEVTFSVYSVNRTTHVFGTAGATHELSSPSGIVATPFTLPYTVVAGDLSGGNAVFDMYWKRISSGTLTLKNDGTRPVPRFSAKNFGQ